jgi:hypothetical protein
MISAKSSKRAAPINDAGATTTMAASSKRAKAAEMTKEAEEEAALSTLQHVDIKKIMTSDSPEVKCVLLRMNGTTEEISLDMSPRLKMTQATLGGEITFLGQWEAIEAILVIRKDQKASKHMILNKHKLQPPFHNAEVFGDILLMRSDTNGDPKDLTVKKYEAFTKLEIPEWEPEEADSEDEGEEELEEDSDDDAESGDDSEDGEEEEVDEDEDEEAQREAVMAFLAPKIVERFKSEHGREPTDDELTALTEIMLHNLSQQEDK